MSSNVDVLVVGAGPTGLVAALSLAKNGVHVRVIEKLPKHPMGQRGANILPRTLEVYHFLGVLADIKKAGTYKSDLKEWKDGKPVKTYSGMTGLDPTPSFPERSVCLLGQDATCGILREHLKSYGIEVELATELVRLEQDEGSATASVVIHRAVKESEETITVKYVVGADGARGVVRKLLGLSFLGETRSTINMITGDAEMYGVDQDYIHKFDGMPNGIVTLRPTDRSAKENIYFYSAFGPKFDHNRALEDHEYLRQFVYDTTKLPELKIGKIETIANYRPNIRVVNRFNKGRVFVAGGGQGMNSSVMDAFNLGWKLALASEGLANPELLDSYNAERLPVVKEMLERTTTLLNRAISSGDGQPSSGKKSEPPSPWSRPHELNQLGVNYRWSPIVVDELNAKDQGKVEEPPASAYIASGRLHAGDRAPDAPGLVDLKTGGVRRLFDIFGPDHHTVLVFTDGDAALALCPVARFPAGLIRTIAIRSQSASPAEAVADVDILLQDKEGHAHLAYPTPVAIIRPDGVVGALVDGTEGVKKYFADATPGF
ncbi:monooxygenase [Dentipellis sp. KUC8613]|nr:monooxygenase [Dentipellis sp. KUC8613]